MWKRKKPDDASDDMTDHDITLLAVAQSEMEGRMWAQTVRNAGINVLIKAGGPGMGAWASTATFEHRLYVRRDQLDDAREILGDTGVTTSTPRGRRDMPRVNPRSRRKPE